MLEEKQLFRVSTWVFSGMNGSHNHLYCKDQWLCLQADALVLLCYALSSQGLTSLQGCVWSKVLLLPDYKTGLISAV